VRSPTTRADRIAGTWQWPSGRLGVVYDLLVGIACFGILERLVDITYRKDGLLGRTMPVWQEEIIRGTAPAPYVYRQGVPQLRRLLMAVLQPGHAALVVDLAFVVLALIAGTLLGQAVLGRRMRRLGTVVACVALAGAFPSDKPESAAMVALVLVAGTAVLLDRHGVAVTAATLATTIRPDVSILFGLAGLVTTFLLRRRGNADRWNARTGSLYVVPFVTGSAWLALARFFWWPGAPYVTTPVTVGWNLLHAWHSPGLWVEALLLLSGLTWIIAGLRQAQGAARMLVLGGFVTLWSFAISVLGLLGEIRLMMPVLPFCILLNLRPDAWTPQTQASTTSITD
jgi:hypothetical protein